MHFLSSLTNTQRLITDHGRSVVNYIRKAFNALSEFLDEDTAVNN